MKKKTSTAKDSSTFLNLQGTGQPATEDQDIDISHEDAINIPLEDAAPGKREEAVVPFHGKVYLPHQIT